MPPLLRKPRLRRFTNGNDRFAIFNKARDIPGNHTGFCESAEGCEVDHLISLELGGSNDIRNLWPEPYEGEQFNAHVKDRLENFLHAEVCAGRISLTTAQQEIATDWKKSFMHRIGPLDQVAGQ